jgi:hypothetical protein
MAKKTPINNIYFSRDTEDAIILYNKTKDYNVRSKIYEKHIHYPFFKLTENIIHTFKFYNTDVEELIHLQHEIITFLISKLHLYNHTKNINDKIRKITKRYGLEYNSNFEEFVDFADRVTKEQINDFIDTLQIIDEECLKELDKIYPPKAYSYFGTIVKRYLIIYNQKNYNKKINSSPIELLHDDIEYTYSIDSNSDLGLFFDEYINYVNNNIDNLFSKEKEAIIARAIMDLFSQRNNLDIFKKKALYLYIREMIDVKTPNITKISNILYDIFKKHYSFYLENGYTNFK